LIALVTSASCDVGSQAVFRECAWGEDMLTSPGGAPSMKEERAAVRDIAAVSAVRGSGGCLDSEAMAGVLIVAGGSRRRRGLAGLQREAGTSLHFSSLHMCERFNG
jgi:hypothetical protein